jgi:hypothetical protein
MTLNERFYSEMIMFFLIGERELRKSKTHQNKFEQKQVCLFFVDN